MFIMRQITEYRWQIVNPKGNIIQDDIYLKNAEYAREYARAWISSFHGKSIETKAL